MIEVSPEVSQVVVGLLIGNAIGIVSAWVKLSTNNAVLNVKVERLIKDVNEAWSQVRKLKDLQGE